MAWYDGQVDGQQARVNERQTAKSRLCITSPTNTTSRPMTTWLPHQTVSMSYTEYWATWIVSTYFS